MEGHQVKGEKVQGSLAEYSEPKDNRSVHVVTVVFELQKRE
jgi:hypothetical protein